MAFTAFGRCVACINTCACGDGTSSDADNFAETTVTDTDAAPDKTEPPATDVQPPNGRYSPEWLYQKVLEDETVQVWLTYSEESGGAETAYKYCALIRDGDLVSVEWYGVTEEGTSLITYYDLGEDVRYATDDDWDWFKEPIDPSLDWKAIVEKELPEHGEYWLSGALVDTNYELDSDGETYWMKDQALTALKKSLMPGATTILGHMYEESRDYYLTLSAIDAANDIVTAELSVYFNRNDGVELPEID